MTRVLPPGPDLREVDLLALMPGSVERIRRACGPAEESGLPVPELEHHVRSIARDAIAAQVAPRHRPSGMPQLEEVEPAETLGGLQLKG